VILKVYFGKRFAPLLAGTIPMVWKNESHISSRLCDIS